MHGVQPNAKARPMMYAPHRPTGFGIGNRPSRIREPIRVSPRKCSPMTMMMIPATIESSADQARISPPIRDALAPSNTKTVEKPSTNSAAESITARREGESDSSLATCSIVAPVR